MSELPAHAAAAPRGLEPEALETLKRLGYRDAQLLGRGKDGIVYRARRGRHSYAVKVLSEYGRRFLPMTRALIAAGVDSPCLLPVRIRADRVHEYPFEPLEPVETAPDAWFPHLVALCQLQRALLQRNLLLWDLGFSAPNYRVRRDGSLCWIDYGGNGFLFVRAPADAMESPRPALVVAHPDFVRAAWILHLAVFGLGAQHLRGEASRIQDHPERARDVMAGVLELFRGTVYEAPARALAHADVLAEAGWREIEAAFSRAISSAGAPRVLERADIERVWREGEVYRVRGYQNFDIGRTEIRVLDRGHAWARSARKWRLVDGVLSALPLDSFLDVGCNLGLYVFSAHLRQGVPARGVDYNPRYIELCRTLATDLGLDCSFSQTSFGALRESADCVSALGILHHLYHRTESYGCLEEVVARLARLARRFALVELPTEEDPKARKWTQLPGRAAREPYRLEAFLRHARAHFASIEEVGAVTPTRPLFLLRR